MEKIRNVWEFVKNFVIIAYILLIIFVTICLLSFNEYKVTEFGANTIIPIIDEDLEPDYTVGDLVIVKKGKLSRVDVGDVVFFYRTTYGVTTINFAKVIKAEMVTDTEFTYTVEGDYIFSSSYFIGEAENATVIPKVGRILSILQSKWGFLFLGVFPSLVAFLYTLHYVVTEIQENKEAERKKKKKKKKKKAKTEKVEKDNVEKQEIAKDETIKEMVSEIVENDKKEEKADVKQENEIKESDEKTTEKNEIIEPEIEEDKPLIVQIEKDDKINNVVENKIENKPDEKQANVNEIKEEIKTENVNQEIKVEQTEEQKKKAAIEAKMKTMTEEEKRALIEAKLKSMTPEEKRALIEAKKKKLEAEKNKKGE